MVTSNLENETLIATLELSDDVLVDLWNTFVEESALYGEDSYIYNLSRKEECEDIIKNMEDKELAEVFKLLVDGNKFIHWYYLNGNEIKGVEDVKSQIRCFWGEIFERIMLFPIAYELKISERYNITYFTHVFFPIIIKQLGYHADYNNGTIEKNS